MEAARRLITVMAVAALAVTATLVAAPAVQAAVTDTTWTGATSTAWSDATNWSDGAPEPGSKVHIPAGATIDVDADLRAATWGMILNLEGAGISITGDSLAPNEIHVAQGASAHLSAHLRWPDQFYSDGASVTTMTVFMSDDSSLTVDKQIGVGTEEVFRYVDLAVTTAEEDGSGGPRAASDATFTLGGDVPHLAYVNVDGGVTLALDMVPGTGVAQRISAEPNVTSLPGRVEWLADDQFLGDETAPGYYLDGLPRLSLSGGAQGDLNGHSDGLQGLGLSASTLTLGGGSVTLSGYTNITGAAQITDGVLTVDPDTTLAATAGGAAPTVSAQLVGANPFTVNLAAADKDTPALELVDSCLATGTLSLDGTGQLHLDGGYGGVVTIGDENEQSLVNDNPGCDPDVGSVPSAPTSASATLHEDGTVTVTWAPPTYQGVPAFTGYQVLRAKVPYAAEEIATLPASTTTFTDAALPTDGGTYDYMVVAVSDLGVSTQALAGAIVAPKISGPPAWVYPVVGNTKVSISWGEPLHPGTTASGTVYPTAYEVLRSTSPDDPGTTIATVTGKRTYLDEGLTNGTTYYYSVRALDAVGEGELSDPVAVTPKLLTGVSVSLAAQSLAYPGAKVRLAANLENHEETPVEGPMAVTLLIPEGLGIDTNAAFPSWQCATPTTLGDKQVLTCRTLDGIAAMGAANTLLFDLNIPLTAALGTEQISYSATAFNAAAASTQPFDLHVEQVARAHLDITHTQIGSIGADEEHAGTLTFTLTNSGESALVSQPSVSVFLDPSLHAASNDAWDCEQSYDLLRCTLKPGVIADGTLQPGADAPPLELDVWGDPQPYVRNMVANIYLNSVGEDAYGELGVSTAYTYVVRPHQDPQVLTTSLGDVPDAVAASAKPGTSVFRLVTTNSGGPTPDDHINFVMSLPTADITITKSAADTDWNCTQVTSVVLCTSTGTILVNPGDTVEGPLLEASLPAGIRLGAAWALNAYASTGYFTNQPGKGAGPSAALDVDIVPEPVAAVVSTMSRTGDAPLWGGAHSTATLSLRGDKTQDAAPVTVGLVVPSGLTLDPAAISAQLSDEYPGAAAAPVCAVHADATPDGASALVCVAQADVPANSALDVTTGLSAAANLSGTVALTSGRLATDATASAATQLTQAWDLLSANGTSALADATVQLVDVVTLTADAGPPQRVAAATPGDDTDTAATRVVMDGSATTDVGRPLTYGWVQTAGPAVTWETDSSAMPGADSHPAFPAGTTFTGTDGTTLTDPQGFGVRAAFTVAPSSQAQDLAFRLYVTDGSTVSTALTTVTVDPLEDSPPQITGVHVFTVTGGVQGPEVDLGVTPAAGTALRLVYTTDDAEGDPVLVDPSVVRPNVAVAFTPVAASGGEQTTFDFTWPAGVTQLVIQARATDGKSAGDEDAASGHHSFAIGPDPVPIGLSVDAPDAAVTAGASVGLDATLLNGTVGGESTALTWSQLSGPTAVIAPSGTHADVTVPTTAQAGDTITLEVEAVRGTGSTRVREAVMVNLAVTAADMLALEDVPALTIAPGDAVTLDAQATGGVGPYTYAWQLVSAGTAGSLDATSGSSVGYTAPGRNGLITISVTATDAAGATATQMRTITVAPAAGLPSATPTQPCAPSGPLTTIVDAVNAAKALGDDVPVAVQFGDFQLDLGPAGGLLDGITGCAADLTVNLTDASATYGDVGLTGLTGTVSKAGIVISNADVHVPQSWHLTDLSLHSVSFSFTTFELQGTLRTTASLPMLSTPSAASAVTTELTFSGGVLVVSASATLNGATVSFSGGVCTASAGCTSLPTAVPASVTSLAPHEFAVAVAANGVPLLGGTASGSGVLTNAGGSVTGSIHLDWTAGSSPPSDQLQITSAYLDWSPAQLAIGGSAVIAGRVGVSLDGTYVDANNWSVDVQGGLVDDWTPAQGLTLAKWDASTHEGTGASGSVSRKAGVTTYSVKLTVSGAWSVGPVTVNDVHARIANAGEAPAVCGLTGAATGLYVAVGGSADVDTGNGTVSIAVDACVTPTGWTIASSAPLSGVQIASGVSLAGVSLLARHTDAAGTTPASTSVILAASATVVGVTGSAVVAVYTPAQGARTFVAGVSVDLDDLGLPVSGSGRIFYASQPVPRLSDIPGFTMSVVGTSGDVTAESLGALALPQGLTAVANMALPANVGGFLEDKLGLETPATIAVTVNLTGTPVVTASLDAGTGVVLVHTDNGTEARLTKVSLRISAGGSFGLIGEGTLALPRPDASSATDVSPMTISAGVMIQLGGAPAITIVLSKTGGDWVDALGTQGLVLGDFAIQGGVVFGTGIPTPSIGVGAVVKDMPESWKTGLGIVSESGGMEPVTFVLNISAANPIFQLTLGVANGQDFMRPLARFDSDGSTTLAHAFTIDYASLVIAPFGGQVGPFVYQPGFHLGFAASVVGVTVAVKADVDVLTGSMAAHVDVGSFSVGGVTLKNTVVDFAVEPVKQHMAFAFSGGLVAGPLNADATVTVEAGRVAGSVVVRASLDAHVGNLDLGVGTLEQLNIYARADLSAGVSTKLTNFELGGTARATVLGTTVALAGGIGLTQSGLQYARLVVGASTMSAGGVTVGGSGCSAKALAAIPAGSGIPAFPTNGPCLQLQYESGSHPTFYIGATGTLSAPALGLDIEFDGEIDGTGIAITTASVRLTDALRVELHDSRFYFGDLTGVTDTDAAGNVVAVNSGDFTLRGTVSTKLASYFDASLTVDVGKIGATAWAKGAARLALLDAPDSPVSADVTLKGDFAKINGTYVWSLSGSANLKLSGFDVASAYFLIDSYGRFTIEGSLCVGPRDGNNNCEGPLSGDLTVKFTNTQEYGPSYFASATGSFSILGASVKATISIDNLSANHTVSASASIKASLPGDLLSIDASANFTSSGAICVSGTARLDVGSSVSAGATFCTPQTGHGGVSAYFNIVDFFGVTVTFSGYDKFAAMTHFDFSKDIDLIVLGSGVKFGFSVHMIVGISSYNGAYLDDGTYQRTLNKGLYFEGGGSMWGAACGLGACISGNIGSLSVTVNPTTYCGSILNIVSGCYQPPNKIWQT